MHNVSGTNPASFSEIEAAPLSDEQWAQTVNRQAYTASIDATNESQKGGNDLQAQEKAGEDAFFNRFRQRLDERGPISQAQLENLVKSVAAEQNRDVYLHCNKSKWKKKAAQGQADQISSRFSYRCYAELMPNLVATGSSKDTLDNPGLSSRVPLSVSSPAPKPAPKKSGWTGVLKRPGVFKKHKLPSKKRPRDDEEAALLSVIDNIKHSFGTPAKEVAGAGIIMIGFGGVLALPFAIWTAQDLCRPKSDQHDAQGCRVALAAAVGASLIAIGGILTGLALTCYDHGRAAMVRRKYERAKREEESDTDTPTAQPEQTHDEKQRSASHKQQATTA